ncbi:hypothetical protein [Spirochaeta dissipatitropha]
MGIAKTAGKGRRPKYYAPLLTDHIHPQLLFFTGALCVVLYLLNDSLFLRALQVALFAFLATMNGKRIMWGYFILMVGSITFFHLFQPIGQVYYRIGNFRITSGAIEAGLFKGLTIIGLVFISLFCIRPNLRLPGNWGGLLGGTLYYFEMIIEHRKGIKRKNFVGSIDAVLEDIFPSEYLLKEERDDISKDISEPQVKNSLLGYCFCALLVTVNLGLVPLSSFLG